MAFDTTDARTELGAVNEILASIGQAPVSSLEQTNPDVAICYNTLIQISREVQSEGWTFNTESEYPFTPDVNDQILIPSNILRLELSRYYNINGIDAVRRDGKLYNKTDHTFTWTQGTVYCDVLWFFTWVDIPAPVQDYILSRAAVVTASRLIGDSTQFQLLQEKERYMRSFAIEYESNQGNYSMFGRARNAGYYSEYQPYRTLMR